MASRLQRLFVVPAAIAIALTVGSCGGGGGTVAVTLQEFSIGTDPTTADAGEFAFEAANEGPDDVHEFVVFLTDLDLTELPTDENGAVVETGEGIELIGEIEDIAVGETKSVTLELEAGTSSSATSGTRPSRKPTTRRGCARASRWAEARMARDVRTT